MGPLSNLHRKAMALLGLEPAAPAPPADAAASPPSAEPARPAPPPSPVRRPAEQNVNVRPARREELFNAVRMILSGQGRVADDEQVTAFIRAAVPPRVDLSLLRVAERRGRLLWALLPVVSPGRTALMLAPPVPHGSTELAAAASLIEMAAAELAAGGTHLAQALLDPADVASEHLFAACGFAAMAELIYLAGAPRRRPVPVVVPDGMRWVGYAADTHHLFRDTITRSYEHSLDCPALNGLRAMDDVIEGHKASGEFDPRLWRLLCLPPVVAGRDPEPLGILLLARVPQAAALELVYLGLVPEARGRRLGDLLVRAAIAGVTEAGMSRLSLAVDARNAPALRLYYRHGLSRSGSRLAVMRDLRPPTAAATTALPVTSFPVPADQLSGADLPCVDKVVLVDAPPERKPE